MPYRLVPVNAGYSNARRTAARMSTGMALSPAPAGAGALAGERYADVFRGFLRQVERGEEAQYAAQRLREGGMVPKN